MCVYKKSLCYSRRQGLAILVDNQTADGVAVDKDDTLAPAPFHVGWDAPDVDVRGPPHWRPSSLPYRSFVTAQVRYRHASRFLSTENVTRVGGWTAVLAFDADNYNIYHWVNTVYAAFLARLKHIERVGGHRFDARATTTRLMKGQGFDTVLALRGRPTDWQQNYADIVLGVKDVHTRYSYLDDDEHATGDDDAYLCFDRAIVPGAALYLSSSITNAHLVRRMAAAIKNVSYSRPEYLRASFAVTWFVRNDKRAITNMDEALQATRSAIAHFEARRGVNVSLDVVHWTDTDPFVVQASQMARSRVFITTHGSAINHAMFMPTGSAVIEINAHQFRYALDDIVILLQGHHYTRYVASMHDTRHHGLDFSDDPFPGTGAATCNESPDCALSRRDADIRVDVGRWEEIVGQGLDAVV